MYRLMTIVAALIVSAAAYGTAQVPQTDPGVAPKEATNLQKADDALCEIFKDAANSGTLAELHQQTYRLIVTSYVDVAEAEAIGEGESAKAISSMSQGYLSELERLAEVFKNTYLN